MEVNVPESFSIIVAGGEIRLKSGAQEELVKFNPRLLKVGQSPGLLKIEPHFKLHRKTKAVIMTLAKHLENFFSGQTYQKKMQVVYAHFPVSIEVKGIDVIIKNFLGEKAPRRAKVIGNTQVQVSGQEIIVKGKDKQAVGQTAANIRQAVRIVGKDRRVFQDGIYLVE